MDEIKRVKVDNWGIYFLQRLKHFFNRTDFCDLTLQFQDKAQLKVHRLVLSACTEYFEVLERTCEMYDDCLVMPEDLQADVVVPIVNFMYTGHLEFKIELLEKLYITSQVMNMPVLTKLLEAHRVQALIPPQVPKSYSKSNHKLSSSVIATPSTSNIININKRSYSKAFENHVSSKISSSVLSPVKQTNNAFIPYKHRKILSDPKPTRYEVPEELESDVDDSFSNISYESKPLIIHLENNKTCHPKRSKVVSNSSAKEIIHGTSTVKIIDNLGSKSSLQTCSIFDEDSPDFEDKTDVFQSTLTNVRNIPRRNTGFLFDQILDSPEPHDAPKVTVETCDSKQASNLDHAKIISEVLKKYPHLVKSNKNIKLKILNAGSTTKAPLTPPTVKKPEILNMDLEPKLEKPDYVETDILDAKKAAKLISLGALNIKGPWVCLICGTPEKAILFKSYYTFRRHLVEVHNEKPVLKICEYCGMNTPKRNYLFHHLLTKHGIEPPPTYNFPRCNVCDYIGLTEALLVKHKVSHSEYKHFKCNVCASSFTNSSSLLLHIQKTGHKYTSEKKNDLQCIYCLRVFTRKANLYAHIKTNHKQLAKLDGIIDDSDEERQEDVVVKTEPRQNSMLYEYSVNYEQSLNHESTTEDTQKILNSSFPILKSAKAVQKPKIVKQILNKQPEILQHDYNADIPENNLLVTIDGEEYMVKDNQLIPHHKSMEHDEYVISDFTPPDETSSSSSLRTPSTSTVSERKQNITSIAKKTSGNSEQPIQIVVSNDEEYKALMSTNHSIIFDDVDNNKTLTVLTTAESTDLNNTIDMDVAQSNEMMILPGNYPLDVSSAVTSNNSNIVVVYSHPQEGSAEFVQTTAVHYETLSPSSTIINTNVLQQGPESWPNEIQDDSGMQTVNEPITFIDQNSIVQEQELEDLPNVQLTDQTDLSQTYTQEVILSQNYSDNAEHVDSSSSVQEITENMGNIVEEDVGSVPTIPMEVVIPSDLNSVEECNASEHISSAEIQEELRPPCEDGQEIHNIHVDEIETSSHIDDISAGIQKKSIVILQNKGDILYNNMNEVRGTDDQLEKAIKDASNIIENCNDNLETVQGPQNIACHEISNDTNQIYEIVSNEHLDIVVNAEVETSHDILQNSDKTIPNESEDLPQEIIQTSQCDFSPSQQLLDSIEVSESTEIQSNVIIICNDLVDVNEEVASSQLIEDVAANVDDELQNKDSTDNKDEIQPSPEKIPEVIKEKIQNLTSEWSEDELETSKQQTELNFNEVDINTLAKSSLSVDISNISRDAEYVEESIENIQQEMEKQLTETESDPAKQHCGEVEEIQTHSEHCNKGNAQPEQISSLLNDWEDNEEPLQEASTNEDIDIFVEKAMSDTAQESTEQRKPSNDKIKSLVIDWDDDEDDNKT